MKNADADFQAGINIGQGLAISVMEMTGQTSEVKFFANALKHGLHMARGAHAYGVGDINFVAT
jgi:hypothetical protein